MTRVLALWLTFLLLPVAASAAPEPNLWPRWQAFDANSTVMVDHSAWADFLGRYLVTEHPSGVNRMRYAAVTSEGKKALDGYLDRLQGTAVSTLNRQEQKAYWINLYNALTVRAILDHYPVKSIRDIDISPGWFSSGPWDARLLTIEGVQLSLNDIEHRILRPIWQDNRVHYAVNCASLGCPNLRAQPFTADNLEEILNQAARDYVNHPRGMRVEGDKAILSSIYDWFQVDFGGNEEGVRQHLLKYAGSDRAEYLKPGKVHFSYDYDWALNE
ncbi:MAG: Ser/Thr protein kinase [Desulfuromonas sp.]|nr:MAG: Ser/Thr protein kinase [Desulfuromonas sp.]